jgi:ATP-binding cassette subfamily B protein
MLVWVVPGAALPLACGTLLLIAIAFGFEPLYAAIDMRARTHAGALTRFYLDALSGLTTIHAHCAERSVRREQEALLTDWLRAVRDQIRASVSQTTAMAVTGFLLVGWLIRLNLQSADDPAGVLLVAFWGLQLPMFASDLASSVQAWTGVRSIVLRVLEPIDAPEEAGIENEATELAAGENARGVNIAFQRATFAAAGRDVLRGVDLEIPSGAAVAIVGASGAGKSTLVGALLGFVAPGSGEVLIDGEPLTASRVTALRRVTAWVDPGIQLFNAPMEENVRYSTGPREVSRLPFVLSEAGLYDVLQRIPDSRTPLGDSGGTLSGGEGQRVRIGRAMMQSAPRLVILDEAFRGLDRDMRLTLLRRCRALWSDATLLYVTHDAAEVADADRVLVLDAGRVVEYDTPAALGARAESHYATMLGADRALRDHIWNDPSWRRIEMREGSLREINAAGPPSAERSA